MDWSNDLTLEFLFLYEREEAIWNTASTQHKNKKEVHDAWLRIKEELKDGTISIADLKKKKENLMSTYRKVKTKIKDSTRTGSGSDDIYRPEWPFYRTMANFLDDIYKPRNTTVLVSDDSEEDSNEASIQTTQNFESSEGEAAFKTPKTIPKKKRKIDETQDRMDEAYNYLKKLNQKPQKDVPAMYCDLLAEKLRNLKAHTLEIAMLEIDKVIYNLKQHEKRQQPTTPNNEVLMTQVLQQPPSPWQQVYQPQPPYGYQQYFQLQPFPTHQPSPTHQFLYPQPPNPQNQRVLSSQGATSIQPSSALPPGHQSHYHSNPYQSTSIKLSQGSPNQSSSSPSPPIILPDL